MEHISYEVMDAAINTIMKSSGNHTSINEDALFRLFSDNVAAKEVIESFNQDSHLMGRFIMWSMVLLELGVIIGEGNFKTDTNLVN